MSPPITPEEVPGNTRPSVRSKTAKETVSLFLLICSPISSKNVDDVANTEAVSFEEVVASVDREVF